MGDMESAAITTLVCDKNGSISFNESSFHSLCSKIHTEHSILTILSPSSISSNAKLLDELLYTSFSTFSTNSIFAQRAKTRDGLVLANPPRELLVLAGIPFGNLIQQNAHAQHPISHVSAKSMRAWTLSMSNVVLLPVFLHDMESEEASGRSVLKESIQEMIELHTKIQLPKKNSNKKLLIVIVKDFDPEEISSRELISFFTKDLESTMAQVKLSYSESSTGGVLRVSDVFELEFCLFPSATLSPEKYSAEFELLRSRMLDPTEDEYIFDDGAWTNGVAPAELASHAKYLASQLSSAPVFVKGGSGNEGESIGNSAEWELTAVFQVENARYEALRCFMERIQDWKAQVSSERIVRQFGEESGHLVDAVLSQFEEEAKQARHVDGNSEASGTKSQSSDFVKEAVASKKAGLVVAMSVELYAMYTTQIMRLREVAYEMFDEKLETMQVTENVEKDVGNAVKESEKFFTSKANGLKPRGKVASKFSSSWRFDSEKKELLSALREKGTEHVQMARLQGAYNPKPRQPISFSFHYLETAPLGITDSRYEALTPDANVSYSQDDLLVDNVKPRVAALPSRSELIFAPEQPAR